MKDFGLRGVLLLIVLSAVDGSAQTIADVARRERERLKNLQSAATITNGETTSVAVSTSSTPAAPSGAPATQPKGAAPSKPSGPVDNQGRDEKYWKDAFQKARTDGKRADDKVLILEQKLRDLNTKLLQQSDIYNRENRIASEKNAAQAEIDAARKEAGQAKQKLADLEEQLRRAGGPPGWAR